MNFSPSKDKPCFRGNIIQYKSSAFIMDRVGRCGKESTFHVNCVLSRVERNSFNIFEREKI